MDTSTVGAPLAVATAIAVLVAIGLYLRSRQVGRRFAELVRRDYPLRIFDLRLYRWVYSDLLLRWFLRASVDRDTPTIVVTGDSTVAQMSIPPRDTVVGQLEFLMSLRPQRIPARILNIGVNGTAEAYLDASIAAALDAGARHVLAGVTIRDYTHVNEELQTDPTMIPLFLGHLSFSDFEPEGTVMTRPRAIALRVAYRLRYLLTGSGVLAHGHLPTASAQPSAAADRDGPPDTAAASSRASRSGEYQTSTLYVAEEELARRTALKNARKAQLLDDNPYVKRLEIVMRRHISSARHVSFVLMPMNTAIDVDRLGLDPSIPAGVAQRIVALGTRHGFAVHDLGALWEGKFFANEDVVHLNRQGSMQAAAMLARSSAALAGLVPTVRTRPIIGLIERYRASVGAETFARTLQLLPEDESFRLVALGDAHAYLATSLERPFLLTAVPYAIGPGEPPRIRIVRESGEIAFDAPLREGVGLSVRNGVDEIEIAHAGLRIRAADPAAALTFGYVDQASADRECFIRVDRIFEFEADPAGPRA